MKMKILIGESNPDNAELIIAEIGLVDHKNEIILMKDGQEIIDYFQKTELDCVNEIKPQIDLIILDHVLPIIRGVDVLRFLKNDPRHSSIPVIIYSASFDPETISEAYDNGTDGFIIKPSSFKDYSGNTKFLKKYLSKA